ncbi:hypothetical protein CL684_00455 [Candidatus Campbellbacteria bacterium]|nr:hypothetical protein [Candidatus Campbellbacteria bacterium]|tara:strand:- start:1102 stop:1293 length:192 start_codon:yes stop_codon:yes gene_type:complete
MKKLKIISSYSAEIAEQDYNSWRSEKGKKIEIVEKEHHVTSAYHAERKRMVQEYTVFIYYTSK